jgi:hypothetical protein
VSFEPALRQLREAIRKRLLTRKERGARPGNRWGDDGWQQDELALLGTLPDAEVAARIGCSTNAVRVKRTKLRIPTARAGRRRQGQPGRAGTQGGQRGE